MISKICSVYPAKFIKQGREKPATIAKQSSIVRALSSIKSVVYRFCRTKQKINACILSEYLPIVFFDNAGSIDLLIHLRELSDDFGFPSEKNTTDLERL